MCYVENKFNEAIKELNESWLEVPSLDWYNYIMMLPQELKTVYCIVVFENQIFNGGLHQYFSNGYGQFSDYTIKALRKIGAENKANILKEAFRLVNIDNEEIEIFAIRLRRFNISSLFKEDILFEPLEALDDEYENLKQEDIYELLERFINDNS